MNAATAREIIAQALEDETTELESVPEDDDAAIAEGERLVQMAQDAWDQNIQGPEVEAILKIAARDADDDGGETAKPKAKPKPAAKAKPAAKPAAKGRPTRKAEPEPDPEPEPEPEDSRAQEEPYDGYSTDKVGEIVEALEIWAEDEEFDNLTHVLLFEQAHKNRVRIINKLNELLPSNDDDDAPDADPEPDETPAEPEQDEEQTASNSGEPFEGYDGLKMNEVFESMDEYLGSDEAEDEEKLFTLRTVYDYEAVNKGRAKLLDYLDEKSTEYGYVKPTRDDPDPNGVDAEPDEPKPASKSRAKKSGTSSQEFAVNVTAELNGNVVVTTLPGKHAAAGLVLDLLERGAESIAVTTA